MEGDTMDGADARPAPGRAEPQEPTAEDAGEPAAADEERRALPAPERPARPRGRHEAPRRTLDVPARAAVVVAASVLVVGVLATWLIGSAEEAPQRPAPTGGVATAGPTSRPPGSGSFGNLVVNWSFEQDLNGWQVLGAADTSREPQGRTSGSCAVVRARGPQPAQVGLALPQVAPAVKQGQRYVASAWVRSPAPGQRVTIRLVGADGKEGSRTTTTTLPGLAWRRVFVAHTVHAATALRLEIVADAVPAGGSFLIDEVIVRLG